MHYVMFCFEKNNCKKADIWWSLSDFGWWTKSALFDILEGMLCPNGLHLGDLWGSHRRIFFVFFYNFFVFFRVFDFFSVFACVAEVSFFCNFLTKNRTSLSSAHSIYFLENFRSKTQTVFAEDKRTRHFLERKNTKTSLFETALGSNRFH